MSDLETKEKIIKFARILFADKGYEGTSIREIAKLAGVNVASVNYYFSSKEKLFQEILQAAYETCSNEMKAISKRKEGDLAEILVDFFRYLTANSPDLLSHYKMMMSSQHSHNLTSHGTEDGIYGPPGGMIIATSLKREIPDLSLGDLHWALKTLFSHVSHISLIYTCCLKTESQIPFSGSEDLEKGIRRLTRLVLNELRNL